MAVSRWPRGALYLMLQNRIYRGEIVHKGKSFPGEHEAIIDETLWNDVQAILCGNRVHRTNGNSSKEPRLLTGILFDASGGRMSPTHATKKGTRYRLPICLQEANAESRRGVVTMRSRPGWSSPSALSHPAERLATLILIEEDVIRVNLS